MASKFDHEEVRDLLDEAGIKATVVYLGHTLIVRFRETDRIVAAVETFVLEEPFRLILEVGYEVPVEIKPTKPPSSGPTKRLGRSLSLMPSPKRRNPWLFSTLAMGGRIVGQRGIRDS